MYRRVSANEVMKKSKYCTQILTGFVASLSLTSLGFHLGWSSPSLLKLQAEDSDLPVTSSQGSWIASLYTVGTIFGAVTAAALLDRLGRKLVLILAVIPFVSSCILIAWAQKFWWLYIARFIAGLGGGITYSSGIIYVAEIADDKIRGGLVALVNHMQDVGILLSYSVGPWISRQALAGVGAAVPIIFGLIFVWLPDTPYSLVIGRKFETAERTLMWLKGRANVQQEMLDVKANIELDSEKNKLWSIKKLVMVPANRKALLLLCTLVLARQFSGIGAVLAYSSLIFEASESTLSSGLSILILGVVQLISGFVSILTVDLAGRRPLLLLSSSGATFFLIGEALYFHLLNAGVDVKSISWIPMTAMIGYVVFFAIGLGSLPIVLISEIIAFDVKAVGTMIVAITGAAAAVIVTKLYQSLSDAYGIHVSFWSFSGITILSTIFIYFFIPETKQRKFIDIRADLE